MTRIVSVQAAVMEVIGSMTVGTAVGGGKQMTTAEEGEEATEDLKTSVPTTTTNPPAPTPARPSPLPPSPSPRLSISSIRPRIAGRPPIRTDRTSGRATRFPCPYGRTLPPPPPTTGVWRSSWRCAPNANSPRTSPERTKSSRYSSPNTMLRSTTARENRPSGGASIPSLTSNAPTTPWSNRSHTRRARLLSCWKGARR